MKTRIPISVFVVGALSILNSSCSNDASSDPQNCGDFTIEVTPAEENVPSGDTGTFGVLVDRMDGFEDDINLTLGQIGVSGDVLTDDALETAGIIADFTFDPARVSTGQNSTLTLQISPGIAENQLYTFVVVGTSVNGQSSCNGDQFFIRIGLPPIP